MRGSAGHILALLVVWAVTAGTAALAQGTASTAAPAHQVPSPSAHPPVQGPRGWQPGDFRRARLWVPKSWAVEPSDGAGTCEKGGGELLLGTGPFPARPGRCSSPVVRVEAAKTPPADAASRSVNGYAAFTTARPGTDVGRWWVPALGVAFNLPVGVPVAVLRTIGPSPLGVVTEAGTTTPVPPGWRRVVFAGVQVATPASWPTASGDLTSPCAEPFGRRAVYIGPDQGASQFVNCPLSQAPPPPRDGIWLQAGNPQGWPTVTLRLPTGIPVAEASDDNGPLLHLWFHGLFIQLGVGSDPFIERAVLGSLRYEAGASDTSVRYACPTWAQHGMPRPVRLARHLHLLSFDGDGFYLARPRAGQHPLTSATAAWRQAGSPGAGVSYRLYLARLTDDQAGGQHGTLVWAVYGVPHMTGLGPCSDYVLWLVNARTGKLIEEASGF